MIDTKQIEGERQTHILEQHFEHFIKTYAPQVDDRVYFERDLFMLVRAIHADAARPYEKTMSAMLQTLPLTGILSQDKPK